MTGGPLIPGMREFDGPKKRVPGVLWWVLSLIILGFLVMVGLGAFTATGPMHSIGEVTSELQPVAFRRTTDDRLVQAAVTVPRDGICRRDAVVVTSVESAESVAVGFSVTSSRNTTCALVVFTDNLVWVDVPLDAPLGPRRIIRADDGQELRTDRAAGLG